MSSHLSTTSARSLVLLRVVTLYPALLAWTVQRPTAGELALVLVLASGTTLLALRWRQFVPFLRRHVALAGLDVLVSLMVLAQAGTESPFVAYTFTTAVLVGLLFTRLGAVLLTTLLGSGYLLIRLVEQADQSGLGVFSVPCGYAVLATAGAAFRRLHDRLAASVEEVTDAERSAAVANERTRLARDLHDGVTSSLQGLVLQSMAVSRAAASSDPRTAQLAGQLEQAARTAHAQSREVLTGLRREDDSAPLVQAVADRTRRWSQQQGVAATFSADGVADLDASPRIAALRVLDEALENIARHAGARQVQVRLTGDARRVTLTVQDDGSGLTPGHPGVSQGHYGLLGMQERAHVSGGTLTISPATPGTAVTLDLPRRVSTGPAVEAVPR